jgi:ubiquitin-like 1-activating enzyme E1 A
LFQQKVVFCPLKEALDVDWSGEKAKATLKRTTSDYFLLQGEGHSKPPHGGLRLSALSGTPLQLLVHLRRHWETEQH